MLEALIALLFGLLIGSFLNVCIYRLPRDLSVVKPRSHCIACEKTIAWYDNVPVVSYVLLGGRCRYCQAHISYRYPVVEVATGLLFFYWVLAYGVSPFAIKMCVFMALLVGLIFSDLEELILPDEMTLGGILLGMVFAYFVPLNDDTSGMFLYLVGIQFTERFLSVAESAFSAAFPAFFLWGGGWLYEKIRHREGLGLGDVKLIAMVGAFLGLHSALVTLIAGSIAGSIVGYAYIKFTGKDASTYELPFGTFLGLAAIVAALLWNVI